ncbi:MAG: RNA polymerase subunit sigma-70 [Candidatus Nanopelagicales bacterium]
MGPFRPSGDAGDLSEQFDAQRGALLAHCYRMLGSFDEAEDMVQETFIRAWRASDRYDPGLGSIRTWLHRIATNVCLTALESRRKRPLPSGLGAPGSDPQAPLVPDLDIPWLQPFPDDRLGSPEDAALQRAGLRLAFVAALQLLPARQRAALVLMEVLQFSAAEVADALGSSVASVNSSVQRARATLRTAGPVLEQLREPTDPTHREVVEQYLEAFEAADVPRLAHLLADQVALEMPPVNLWLQGARDYAEFLRRVFGMRGSGWRMLPVQANGTTALAAFAPSSGGGDVRPHSIQLFDVRDGLVERCVTFVDPALVKLWSTSP